MFLANAAEPDFAGFELSRNRVLYREQPYPVRSNAHHVQRKAACLGMERNATVLADEMRFGAVRLEAAPVFAAYTSREDHQAIAAGQIEDHPTIYVRLHRLDNQKVGLIDDGAGSRVVAVEQLSQLCVLEIGVGVVIPGVEIDLGTRISWLPEIGAAGNNRIRTFQAPGALNVEPKCSDSTSVNVPNGTELEVAQVSGPAGNRQLKPYQCREVRGNLSITHTVQLYTGQVCACLAT